MQKEYKPTLLNHVDNISISCIEPEAKDLLDKIMKDWEEWETRLKKHNPNYEPSFYAFAYWLVRWSKLIKPVASCHDVDEFYKED